MRLSGDVSITNVVFEGNKASPVGIDGAIGAAGPAVSNLGTISAMTNVTFKNNDFFCSEGTYADYKVCLLGYSVIAVLMKEATSSALVGVPQVFSL